MHLELGQVELAQDRREQRRAHDVHRRCRHAHAEEEEQRRKQKRGMSMPPESVLITSVNLPASALISIAPITAPAAATAPTSGTTWADRFGAAFDEAPRADRALGWNQTAR